MAKFNLGDTVKLKSGGPIMTIEDEREGGEYMCVWFDGKNTKRDVFKGELLKPASPGIAIGSVQRG